MVSPQSNYSSLCPKISFKYTVCALLSISAILHGSLSFWPRWAGAPVWRVRNASRQTSLWYVETLLFHYYDCHLPSSPSVYLTLLTTTSVNATCQALRVSFPGAATTTRVNRMQQGDMHNIGVAICSRRTVVSTASHVPARMTPPGYSHLRT